MDAARASVKKFMSRDGKHDTSVHETVAPAVQHENVEVRQHEQATTAIDREVHQDHYHTSEQPIQDSEVLPTQHHQNLIPVEHKSFEHDDKAGVERRLQEERSKYADTHTRVEGQKTHEVAPIVAGEHVHHHVHETIQPVIQKQTIEPHVVHTTVPIHEVHHNAAQHHSASALPAMSMADFKKQGGSLTGREERSDRFEGCPPEQMAGHQPHDDRVPIPTGDAVGDASARDSHAASRDTPVIGQASTTGDGLRDDYQTGSSHHHPAPASYGNDMHEKTTSNTSSTHKPSLMDRLNPKKDSDGDGKAGFMK